MVTTMMVFNLNMIGSRMREARIAQGYSQLDLAEAVGASQQSIAKIERGGTRNSKYFHSICKALNISYEWLVKGDEQETHEQTYNVDDEQFIKLGKEALTEAINSVKHIYLRQGKRIEFDVQMVERAFEIALRGKITGDYLTSALALHENIDLKKGA